MHKSLLLVPALVMTAAFSAQALAVSQCTDRSKLSAGHWVKIETDTTGIYQITPEQLAQWGFADAGAVRVYGTGAVAAATNLFGVYPDDLVPAPMMTAADGRILFYAEGDVRGTVINSVLADVERCHYDTKGVYFLAATGEDCAMETVPCAEGQTPTSYHYALQLIEREVQNPGLGSVFFHGRPLAAGDSETFTFRIKDYAEERPSATVFLRYDAAVNTTSPVRPEMEFPAKVCVTNSSPRVSPTNSISTRLFVDAYGDARFTAATKGSLDDALVPVKIKIPATFKGTYAAIDKVYVIYPRRNALTDSVLIMNMPASFATSGFLLAGADANTVAWDITDPVKPRDIALKLGADGSAEGSIACHKEASRIVAFDAAATHRIVRFAGEVAPQNLHGNDTPQMLIIATRTLLEPASELAEIHRNLQGMDVSVVCQDLIFNEFSSGVRTPAALRRYIKMLYDRQPGRLKYVLMYGPSSYDNRGLVSEVADNLVCYECESYDQAREVSSNYVADQYFGMLADDYTPGGITDARMAVSVGRIPATDAGIARRINEKSRAWLQRTPSAAAFMRVLKFSDDGDYRLHFDHSEDFVKTISAGNTAVTISRADNLLYPWTGDPEKEATRKISRSLARGQGMFYYAGHGTPFSLTGEYLYTTSFIDSHTYDNLPLIVFASCEIFPFDRERHSMAEKLIMKADGGGMGVITSSRKVYIDPNRLFSIALAESYAGAKPGTTGADLLRNARNLLCFNGMTGTLGNNTLCYNYCGDPALPLAVPDYAIDVDIAGELQPLVPAKISGTVRDADGNPVRGFNGSVLVEVYDRPSVLKTFTRSVEDGESKQVSCDENLLAEYGLTVVNGEFSGEITLPEPLEGGSKRVIVTAADAADMRTAAAPLLSLDLAAEAPADAATDRSAPEIVDFCICPDDYIAPGTVGPDFTVLLTLRQPATGIATGNAGIRGGLSVTVNGNERRPDLRGALRFGDDGLARLEIPMSNMLLGRHEIRVDAMSNGGGSVSQTLVALVGTPGIEGTLMAEGADPAGDEVLFRLESSESRGTLVVVDRTGNTVFRKEGCTFPYAWNVADNEGRRLFPGPYRAWVMMSNESGYGSTPAAEIVVTR